MNEFGTLVVVIGLTLLCAFPFMWLWNFAVVAALSVAQPITYWPAACLMFFMGIWVAGGLSNKKS